MMALVVPTACLRTTVFECASADDCADAGVLGRCEPTGFCSFPDASCPSEHRYGDHAGDGLGGTCVPEDDGTTGVADTGIDPSASTSPTSLSTTDDTTPLTDGADSSGALTLTSATDNGEETTFDPSAGTSTGAGTETSTSGGIEPQCPSFVDDFEDGVIDMSWSPMHGDYVSEVGGQLGFELTLEADQVYPGVLRHDQDLATGEVRIRIGEAPATPSERLYLAVALDAELGDVLYIMIEGAVLTMLHEESGMFTEYADTPYDPLAHAWLQIRGADDLVHFEVSSDGGTFVTLESVEAPFPLLGSTVVVAATNFAVLDAPAFVSVTDFEICTGG
jgi:hypothetical protein